MVTQASHVVQLHVRSPSEKVNRAGHHRHPAPLCESILVLQRRSALGVLLQESHGCGLHKVAVHVCEKPRKLTCPYSAYRSLKMQHAQIAHAPNDEVRRIAEKHARRILAFATGVAIALSTT